MDDLTPEQLNEYELEMALTMITEGLKVLAAIAIGANDENAQEHLVCVMEHLSLVPCHQQQSVSFN